MKKQIQLASILFMLFLGGFQSEACYNYYTLEGDYTMEVAPSLVEVFPSIQVSFESAKLLDQMMAFQDSLAINYNYKIHSDYGVVLLKLGKTEAALEIFKFLIKHHPDDYQIQSNLGTSYELIGKPDSALVYIKKGLRSYPNSHFGSEWIHLSILEAKIALKNDADWFKTHKLFEHQLDLYKKRHPKREYKEWNDVLKAIQQIHLQLSTRVPFSKAPNQIICQMMLELGDIYSINVSMEVALDIYKTAQVFQLEGQRKLLNRKISATKKQLSYHTPTKHNYKIVLREAPKGNKTIDLDSLNVPDYIELGEKHYESIRQFELQQQALLQAKMDQQTLTRRGLLYGGFSLLTFVLGFAVYKIYRTTKLRH